MPKFICGLNLRTDRIAVSLAKLDKSEIKEISSDYCPSKGIDIKGITNISILIDSLKNVTNQLKDSFADAKFNNVFVSLDSAFIKKVTSSAVIPLIERGHKIVNNADIKKIISSAKAFAQRLDEDLIYYTPLEFIVDNQIVTKNPLGLYAHKLEVKLLCLLASRSFLDNVTYAFRCAGFDIASFMYSPLSSSVNINEDEKKNCAIIDFGRHSTDAVLFKDGILQDIHILRIGSQDITQSLSKEFDISTELAQELTDTHTVLDMDSPNDEDVLIRKYEGYQSIKKSDLTRVAAFVFKEQFKKIKDILLKYKDSQSVRNLFVTGDEILLDGFLELFSKEINTSVKMLSFGNNLKSKHKGHVHFYNSSLGSVKFAVSDLIKRRSIPARGKSIAQKTLAHIKDLYQEYF